MISLSIDQKAMSQLDSCTFIPPSDITAIPQQYMIQMTTSVVPPSRAASFIRCDGDCPNGLKLHKSYYTLNNIADESYRFTVPVTWSNDSNDIEHSYSCKIRFGGINENGAILNDKMIIILIKGLFTQ